MKTIYKTILTIEILSESLFNGESLTDIVYEITDGDWSGNVKILSQNEALTGNEAVTAIVSHGMDAEFFSMDDNGNEIDY